MNNYQICLLLKLNVFRLENFTRGIADPRKIRMDVHHNRKHIEFDNKEYIITSNVFDRNNLATQCAHIGSEYKPAYINNIEEYEM